MRKSKAPKRHIAADPIYNDGEVAKFINYLMKCGKKEKARNIFYHALDIVDQKKAKTGLEVFRLAIQNVLPSIEVKSRRVRGTNLQVPIEVRPTRRFFLGMNWLIKAAQQRSEKTMEQRLAAEWIAAAQNEGNAVKKKEDTHKMANANKAFSHLRV